MTIVPDCSMRSPGGTVSRSNTSALGFQTRCLMSRIPSSRAPSVNAKQLEIALALLHNTRWLQANNEGGSKRSKNAPEH